MEFQIQIGWGYNKNNSNEILKFITTMENAWPKPNWCISWIRRVHICTWHSRQYILSCMAFWGSLVCSTLHTWPRSLRRAKNESKISSTWYIHNLINKHVLTYRLDSFFNQTPEICTITIIGKDEIKCRTLHTGGEGGSCPPNPLYF